MGWATALLNKTLQGMREITGSLAGKLTLAFLLVGVLGVVLFALLIGQRTRTEFDRFLSGRDQAILVDALGDYYTEYGDWSGVRQALSTPPLNFYARDILLLNVDGVVELANRDFQVGEQFRLENIKNGTSLEANGQTVGYVVWLPTEGGGPRGPGPYGPGPNGRPPTPLEDALWDRILWAAVASGVITILLALLLGGWLARTLTAPVRELTTATQAMAAGDFNQRVTVTTQDEIGELALSFNQMSADLARASQLRKQMTADLAHDLRTPLSILRGYLEGLKESRIEGAPVLYGLMYDEVLHLQRLVEDLRTLSLADAGELSLNRRLVDPAALLERTALLYFVAAEQQGIQLRLELPQAEEGAEVEGMESAEEDAEGDIKVEPLPSIFVDTDRITQVLNNLVSNAMRHTGQGEIVLGARAEGDDVYMSIHDTGIGIAAEDLPFVFDRFYRGDKSRQRPEMHTEMHTENENNGDGASSGLGLAIAKAIVEAHGGTIQVASRLGEGTTFTIVMPVAQGYRETRAS